MKPIFTLFIHQQSYGEYYDKHDKFIEEKKEWVKEAYKKPFKELPQDRQIFWEEQWFWPPWKFNCLVGFIDIQCLNSKCLNGEMFLKRKCFSKNHPWKRPSGSIQQNNQFEYYGDLSKVGILDENNSSYVEAIEKIINEASEVIKSINKSYQIFQPPFDWNCYDFKKIVKQLGI